jgi:prophage regulatory protein
MTEKQHEAATYKALAKRRSTARAPVLATLDGERYLTFTDIAAITTWHRCTIYRKVSEGKFPQPVQLSENRVGFRESEVRAWMEERNAAKPHPKPRIRSNQLRQISGGEAA